MVQIDGVVLVVVPSSIMVLLAYPVRRDYGWHYLRTVLSLSVCGHKPIHAKRVVVELRGATIP